MQDFIGGVGFIAASLIWVIGFPVVGTLLLEYREKKRYRDRQSAPRPATAEPMPDTREYLDTICRLEK